MTAAQKAEAAEAIATIKRVEMQMINEMTDAEYARYSAIPMEDRKAMLYVAYKLTR